MAFSDCDSLAENANEKIWTMLWITFHIHTRNKMLLIISVWSCHAFTPMRFAIEVDGKAVGSIGFGSEGDIERVTAEIGYWLEENLTGTGIMPRVVAAVTIRI